MFILRVTRTVLGCKGISSLLSLTAIFLMDTRPAEGATVRETVAAAISATSSGKQREIVLSLKSTPSPEAVEWLDKWKEGAIFVHEDDEGNVTPVLLIGEPDAANAFATVRLADDSPMVAPDGSPIRINPKVVDFADTSSGLRRAMREVADLAALADPDPDKRIRAIQNSAIGQNPTKLPALLDLKTTEKDRATLRALEESIALIRLNSTVHEERVAACETLGKLKSLAALGLLKKVLADAETAKDETLARASRMAIADIDSHIATIDAIGTAFRGISQDPSCWSLPSASPSPSA